MVFPENSQAESSIKKNARTVYDEKYLVKKMMVRLKIALFRTARYGMVDMNALRICIGYHD